QEHIGPDMTDQPHQPLGIVPEAPDVVDDDAHAHPNAYSETMFVPDSPDRTATAESRSPIAERPPPCSMNRTAASTLGPIEPAPNSPASRSSRASSAVIRSIGSARSVPNARCTACTSV